jgi:hypothetical protein
LACGASGGAGRPAGVPGHGHYRQLEQLLEGPVVYVLRYRDETVYTGLINDLDSRLRAHRAGKGARDRPSRLVTKLALLDDGA